MSRMSQKCLIINKKLKFDVAIAKNVYVAVYKI